MEARGDRTADQRPGGATPWRGYLAALVMVVLLAGGMFALDRWVAETITAATVINVAWFALVGGGFLLWARGAGAMTPVAGALGATVLIGGFTFYWTSVRDNEVNEDVVTATRSADSAQAQQALGGETASNEAAAVQAEAEPKPEPSGPANLTLASGEFAGADGHAGSGKATVIEQAGGDRTLTFTDFEVDPGAEVEVWLTPGPEETGDRIELGGLKGNVGDQQYEIPGDADLNEYGTVVLYCTPFTVRIAVAELDRA